MSQLAAPPNSIQGFEEGSLAHDIRKQLQDLTRAVRETGKPGSFTLKLNLAPQGSAQIRSKASVSCSIPQPDRIEELWYDDPDGNLIRRDPRQPSLEDELRARSLE